jgi:TolB-like protein
MNGRHASLFVTLITLTVSSQADLSFGQGRPTPAVTPAAQPRTPTQASSYDVELRAMGSNLVAQLQAAGQKNGTVVDFTDLQGKQSELGRFLAQELSDNLITATKTFSLVDRANLQILLRENKMSIEGLIDPTTTRKLGNLIGIDTVIVGTVTPLGKSVRLSVRAVAIETARVVAAQSATLAGLDRFFEHTSLKDEKAEKDRAREDIDRRRQQQELDRKEAREREKQAELYRRAELEKQEREKEREKQEARKNCPILRDNRIATCQTLRCQLDTYAEFNCIPTN